MKLDFKEVNFKYDIKKENYALFDINLNFFKNEIICLMGESGSGKSTLVQLINGLLLPTDGEVALSFNLDNYLLNNKNKEKRLKQIRKHCGLVFQFSENQLFETNVIKDVMFGPYNFSGSEKESKEAAFEALKIVGIDKKYHLRSPFELSGGEKRKVAIAGILAFHPDILIFDEPTASLDFNSQQELMRLLLDLKKQGKMIIIITHDQNLCYQYADRVVVLKDGKVKKNTSPYEVFFDEELVKEARLELPFVVSMQKKLSLKDEKIRTVDDLVIKLRGHENE